MCSQGRTEKLKRERGKLRKINSFREILNNMSKKGEGVRRTAPPPPRTPMVLCVWYTFSSAQLESGGWTPRLP